MSKKMCPKKSRVSGKIQVPPTPTIKNGVYSALAYYPPTYKENKCGSYIEFYAFDPVSGRMKRKMIKLNRIEGKRPRRAYANQVIARLLIQLSNGWNPWIASDTSELMTFEEAINRYEAHLDKMMSSGYYRKETYVGYKSNVKMLNEYIAKHRPIYYLYQFDRRFCSDFLDYVFIDRNNGAQTRNNYLNFLRVLSGFLVEKGFLKSRPTEGIVPISRRFFSKERECIPAEVVADIAEYCRLNDPEFLLVCQLLYYCFIRPVEITRLRVKDFDVSRCTVTIPGTSSKNKKTQTVTVPKKVMRYAISLGVLSAPLDDFIFSTRLKPGTEEIDTKIFRDHWEKVRKALKLKREWKLYSLKDTGITAMFDNNMTTIAVRDQARHSSLAITDIYTRHGGTVNRDILNMDGAL